MKKIHELLEDIDFYDENLNINEEPMSEEEKGRILEAVLNKAELNKKTAGKKYILPLVAAMTLVLSFATVFAQGGLSGIYYRLFGDNIKYVNEMGTTIDESCTSNGMVYNLANKFGEEGTSSGEVTLNVAGMLGDEHSFYIIFELIKENGESFSDSDYIKFESLRLDLKTSGGYTWYQAEDDDANDNKATFILSGNTRKKIVGDKLTLYAKDFTEYSIKEPVEGFDAYEFLVNNSEYINQSLMENTEKSFVNNTDNDMLAEESDKINKIYNLTPNYVLPGKYSNIPVEKDFHDIYIDNIGFAENKLCIRFAFMNSEDSSLGDIYFVNKNDPEDIKYNEFTLTDENDGVEYYYYIFDIKSMEELSNYDFKYTISKKLSTTTCDWEVKFKADYKNTTETINVNKKTEINGKKYTVKNMKISPIALNVEMVNDLLDAAEDPTHNFDESVSVIMKDGLTAEIYYNGSSTNDVASSVNLMFRQPIDTTQIEKIKIGDMEIKP